MVGCAPGVLFSDMVKKELFVHAVAHNMIRALILQSASVHQRELGGISFKGAVDLLRQWLPPAKTSRASRPLA